MHQAILAGLVRSAHDLSEGGLAVAAAEMCIAGRLGMRLDVTSFNAQPATILFAETNGCLLVEVLPKNIPAFEAFFTDLPVLPLGEITSENSLRVAHDHSEILGISIPELLAAFKGANH